MRTHTACVELVTLVLACSGQAQRTDTDLPAVRAASRPVVVLLRHSVWFSAVNTPMFIAYDNGQVIYPDSTLEGLPVSYQTSSLDVAGTDSVLCELGIVKDRLLALRRAYDYAPEFTDQGTMFFFVRLADSLVRYSVRAGLGRDGQLRPEVPAPLRGIFQSLTHFEGKAPRHWLPDTLLVSAWGYDYASDVSALDWPPGWPDLLSSSTERYSDRFVDEVYVMHLPVTERSRLDSLLRAQESLRAIRINGRKWAVAYRMPFPQEQEWRSLLTALEE